MQFIRNLVFGTAVALFSGFASAHYAIDLLGKGSNLTSGQWTRLESIENISGNPYRAALKVRTSGVALAPGEGLIFTSERDAEGDRFDTSCTYHLTGRMPKASLWSLSVDKTEDEQSIPHEDRRFIVSQAVQWQADGNLKIAIASAIQPGNWLAAPETGEFTVSLRLYDTPLALNTKDTSTKSLPSIDKGACT